MNLSSSELSSGCESGWTAYFHDYSDSSHQYNTRYSRKYEEDEDLSMVSDASSAPPHYHDEEKNCYYRPPEPMKSNPKKEKRKGKEQHSHLDDTATSPAVNFYKHAPDFSSQASSSTRFKEKSTFSSKHFGFFKSSEKQGRLQGKK